MKKTTKSNAELEEQAFKAMLARASQPEPPAGSLDRLMRQVGQPSSQPGNIVPLRRPSGSPVRKLVFAGLPLAASLLLGILIGSDSMPVGFLPESVAALVQPDGYDLYVPDLLDGGDANDGGLA